MVCEVYRIAFLPSLILGCDKYHLQIYMVHTTLGLDPKVYLLKVKAVNISGGQGCGNTMLDLSDLGPFHSGQVENFSLLVLGQVQMC